MQSILIVLLSIAACVIYGIVHDQVTARICVEYFTVFHAPIFRTDDPTILGLGWGVLATWWVGLFLGLSLAIVARAGSLPKRTAGQLLKPIGILMIVSAFVANVAGLAGFVAASNGLVYLEEPMGSLIPPEKHRAFFVDLFMHNASYGSGFVGGLILMAWVWRGRLKERRRRTTEDTEDTEGSTEEGLPKSVT